jgi:pimeloyl-ACP methyl ester carboxylesterase
MKHLICLLTLFALPFTLHAQNMTPSSTGHVSVNGTRLYYETYGSGPALALVAGLGAGTWLWEQQIDDLAEHFTVVAFDNRGVGRSDAPEGPYSIAMMADDLAGVLDSLGIERAHVLGASMGGFIAQEFALRYPERVDRLVLVATSAGGATHVPMSPETLARLMATHEDPREYVRQRLPLAFTEAYLADTTTVKHLVDQRLEHPQPPQAYQAQLAAGATFDAAERVSQIQAPTLVAAATDDLLVPVENAHNLAEALPHAELQVYEDLGHQFFVERPAAFNQDVVAFLQGRSPE